MKKKEGENNGAGHYRSISQSSFAAKHMKKKVAQKREERETVSKPDYPSQDRWVGIIWVGPFASSRKHLHKYAKALFARERIHII